MFSWNLINPPEVGPQVHDLPRPERDQQEGGHESKPLHTGVGALIGVAELLFADAEVVHLVDHLRNHLLDASQLRLDRLQLLRGLDG